MKCNEARPMQSAYLDSELEARTTLEIDQHLQACPECARFFRQAADEEARIRKGLNHGEKTPALWEQIERSLVAAPLPASATRILPTARQPAGWHGVLVALGEQVRAGWQRSPWVWSGLAAGWVVVLTLNFAARGPETAAAVAEQLPPAAEVRLAMKQKRLLAADLAGLSEAVPGAKVQTAPPSPRSERRSDTLNT
jgi:anti-sigma factor RsiW